MTDDLPSRENVIAVTFSDDSKAYEALSTLKELDSQGQIALQGAAVVSRAEDGQIAIKDEVSDPSYTGTATGGLVGLIVGVLGGPFGVLLGGATGLLIGSLFDMDDADDTEDALSELSKSVQVGRTGLLAELTEQSVEVVDNAMAGLGGTVLRRLASDVEAEIAAAEDAQRAAKREARKELIKATHERHMEEVRAKIEELKAKVHGHATAASVS